MRLRRDIDVAAKTVGAIVDPFMTPSSPATLWTTVNMAEAVPGVLTPLCATLWAECGQAAGLRMHHRLGAVSRRDLLTFDPAAGRDWYVGVFFGRAAGNVTLLCELADRIPGSSGEALGEQMFGAAPPGVGSRARHRYPIVVAKILTLLPAIRKELEAARLSNETWWRQVTLATPATLAEAQAHFREAMRRYEDTFLKHCAASMVAQALFEQVARLSQRASEPEGAYLELMTGYGSMAETEVLGDLWAVAHGGKSIEEFLARHGFHGPEEGELSSRSWREDPAPVEALVDAYRELPKQSAPERVEAERITVRRAAEGALLARIAPARRPVGRLILRTARRYVPLREVGKTAYVMVLDAARAAARSAGAFLAQAGTLSDAEDVFFLTVAELTRGIPPDAGTLVAQRRARHAAYRRVTVPVSWTGVPEALTLAETKLDSGPEPGERTDRISGIGVSPGTVEGRVRLVTDPGSAVLEHGEILVCRMTDPSWAPLFLLTTGLVIDIGGAISHGAIVARELGIPCVINTRNGTSELRDGDYVRLDGAMGTVEVLARAATLASALPVEADPR